MIEAGLAPFGDKPFNPRTWFGVNSEPSVWKRDKPLYIGEFLWVPSGTPAKHTVFFGDEARRGSVIMS